MDNTTDTLLPSQDPMSIETSALKSMADITCTLNKRAHEVTLDFRLTPWIKFTAMMQLLNPDFEGPCMNPVRALLSFDIALRALFYGITDITYDEGYELTIRLNPSVWSPATFHTELKEFFERAKITLVHARR